MGPALIATGAACSGDDDSAKRDPNAATVAQQPSDVDIGFCTDMSFHHEQALAMCQRVLGRDTGDQVQAAASEILQNQSYERGLMHAWLGAWGASTAPPDEVMGWMDMAMTASAMPGLASPQEMAALADAKGLERGRMFLELMRAHHEGGVHMAEGAATAETDEVQRLANQMAATQSYEIDVFDQLLATSYA